MESIFTSPAFVQHLLSFLVGILAGFISSALIRSPRWLVAILND